MTHRPTLIVGAEPRVALTVARSLQARGIPVDIAALSPDAPRIASRSVRRFVRVPGRLDQPEQFRHAVEALLAETPYDTLIPSSDTALGLVAGCHGDLAARLHVACPPPEVLRRVLDKDITLSIAQGLGIDIPETFRVADAAGLHAIRGRLRFPLVAKDQSKSLLGGSSFKVRYFGAFEDLDEAFRLDPAFGTRVLLQEYCTGVGVGVAMLIHRGEALATFQHRRLKEQPSTGGVAVLAVAERPDPELAEQALRLLGAIEWEGVAMVEFRDDAPGGRRTLMEINGRYWGTCSFAVRCGLDFPYYQWQVLHGERPNVPASYRPGTVWRWTSGYLQRLHDLIATPANEGVPRPSAGRELLAAAKDLGPWNLSAVGSMRDPAPGLADVGRLAWALARRDARAALRRLVPRGLRRHLQVARSLEAAAARRYLRLRSLSALGLRRELPPGRLASARLILFVCHGNIIRSAMAEALLQREIAHRDGAADVASAGLHVVEGRAADERAIGAARELGISLDDHRARPVTAELVEEADLIFAMDYLNEARLLARFPRAKGKVFLLGRSDGPASRAAEIVDPFREDADAVRRCGEGIQEHVRRLARELVPTPGPGGPAGGVGQPPRVSI